MNYVFDVQHTFREVYDSTKRKMFMSQQSLDDPGQGHSESEMDATCDSREISDCEVIVDKNNHREKSISVYLIHIIGINNNFRMVNNCHTERHFSDYVQDSTISSSLGKTRDRS
jgi:hypothetical protein